MIHRMHTRVHVHVHMYTPALHFIACIREDVTLVCRLLPKFLVIDVILSAEYWHRATHKRLAVDREREKKRVGDVTTAL